MIIEAYLTANGCHLSKKKKNLTVATYAIQKQIPYTLQHHLDHVMYCQCVHKFYALIMLEKWTYKTTHFLIKQALGHQKPSKLFSSVKIYSTVSGNVLETFKNQNKLKDNISITLWGTTAKLGQALCQVDTPLSHPWKNRSSTSTGINL